MRISAMGRIDQKSNVPGKGERIAAFVDEYLNIHKGLSVGELAFRLRCDKRDLQRLIRDRSIGHPLEDCLHAYFGKIFGQAVYGALWGAGPSRREKELDRELAELAALRERLERDREMGASARPTPRPGLRMVPDKTGRTDV